MEKIEELKKLLKINLDELNIAFGWELSITFTNDDFIIDNGSEIIFTDKILNYDVNFESQKRFVLNVVSLFIPIKEEENNYIRVGANCLDNEVKVVVNYI